MIKQIGNEYYSLTFVEFTKEFLSNNEFNRWFLPLISVLTNLDHTDRRQLLLVYGIIIHAMIDTLDEKHLVTSQRPGWANKLSRKSIRDLKFRVFKIYLPFVENHNRYLKSD